MKINFIDPGLNEGAGHHYANALLLISGMAAAGHRVILYCHKSIHAHIHQRLDEICRVVPIFDSFPYPRRFDEIIDHDHQVQMLCKEYETIGPADLWFFPSLFPFQLAALASVESPVKVFGCLHSFFDNDRWNESLFSAKHHDLHIASYEHVITNGIKSLAQSGKFSVLPVLEFCDPMPERKKSLNTVGFFGCQKPTKGQDLIANIISQVVDRGYQVVLQDAWDRFKIHQPEVKNIGYVDSLAEVMPECDLLIFPYDVKEYSRRMSGVLNYCLHLGIPCIVPMGTTLANRVPADICVFGDTNLDEITTALDLVASDYDRISEIFYANACSMGKDNLDEFLRIALS